ncbi:MAG: radical SAM protein [Archangium sp.]|nr:radical SAM protein [Archangium sp.]
MALLDVILGYDCNLACDYCTISTPMRARALSTPAVVQALREGRALGFDTVSFTGGEPTIRGDLLGLVSAARALGFRDVKVQTNGLMLAHEGNLDRLIAAGLTRLHLSIHTHEREAYERLVQREGTWDLMRRALALAVARPITFVADAIIKHDTWARLPDAIDWLADAGVREVHLWYVSLTDGNRDNVTSLPRMTGVMPAVHEALRRGKTRGVEVRSLHVPRCLLGPLASHAWDPGADRVRVVSPDATFDLKDSRLAGHVHVAGCEGCTFRAVCPGVRPDYLAQFGEGEFHAVPCVDRPQSA